MKLQRFRSCVIAFFHGEKCPLTVPQFVLEVIETGSHALLAKSTLACWPFFVLCDLAFEKVFVKKLTKEHEMRLILTLDNSFAIISSGICV